MSEVLDLVTSNTISDEIFNAGVGGAAHCLDNDLDAFNPRKPGPSGPRKRKKDGAGAAAVDMADDICPHVDYSRFRRPKHQYAGHDKVPMHIEDFMDRKVHIEECDPETLKIFLDQLTEKWILENVKDHATIREHAYSMWGLDPSILPNPMVIHKQYKLNIFQTIRIYMQFCRVNLVGNKTEDQMLNTRTFSRIFEVITTMYDLLMAEHRISALNCTDCHVEIPSEISLFRFSFHDFSKNKPRQNLILFVLKKAFERGYRRFNGNCYEQILTPEGYPSHAWKEVGPLKQFLYSIVDKNTNYEQWFNLTSSANTVQTVLEYFAHSPDPEFPFLERDRHVFAFRNGLYFAAKNTFCPFDTDPQADTVVAAKYFPHTFDYEEFFREDLDWYDIPTPFLQSIMDHQEWPEDVCRWWYAMMGRCIYNLGEHDNWQVLPFGKGVANCGKSTLGKVVANFYMPSDIGIMSSNTEKGFGLAPLYSKLIFICYEVKSNFRVEQGDLQSAITGEMMNLARKYDDPLYKEWVAPGMFFGNETGQWADASGSMTRRLLCWEFLKTVTKVNQNLAKDIAKEMPAIIYKSNNAYISMTAKVGTRGIWSCLPDYFKKTQAALAESISPLKSFLESGSGLAIRDGYYMPFKEFWNMHNEFVKDRNFKKPPQITPEYYTNTFEMYGITVEKHEKREWQGKRIIRDWIVGIGPESQFVAASTNTNDKENSNTND